MDNNNQDDFSIPTITINLPITYEEKEWFSPILAKSEEKWANLSEEEMSNGLAVDESDIATDEALKTIMKNHWLEPIVENYEFFSVDFSNYVNNEIIIEMG